MIERFWAKVSPEPMSGCWLWTGNITNRGYGQFFLNYKAHVAHRWAYEHFIGPITAPTLDHLCRVRSCVNPRHLEPVTSRENTLRGIGPTAKNARATTCYRGHPLDEYAQVDRRGWRRCRICMRVRNNRWSRTTARRRVTCPDCGRVVAQDHLSSHRQNRWCAEARAALEGR